MTLSINVRIDPNRHPRRLANTTRNLIEPVKLWLRFDVETENIKLESSLQAKVWIDEYTVAGRSGGFSCATGGSHRWH